MAVILELTVPPEDMVIGRVLPLSGDETVQLESVVPIGGEVVPFVRVTGVDPTAFEATVRADPRVETVERFSSEADGDLFAFDWRLADDPLFEAITAVGGYVLEGTGEAEEWRFRIRLSDQSAVADLDGLLDESPVSFELQAVFQETPPDASDEFGLTRHQREALVAAVESGYFDIPRVGTTADMAAEFDISEQAFIERLRRAVSNLAAETVMAEPAG